MDPSFICHHLNVNPSITPKKQPHRRSSKEHSDAVKDKVIKLKQVGAIKEVFYPEWLVNIVVVKKKSRKWRVCVDFTDLNKACPKDHFPMPRIDQLVDATVGHRRMSFLDSFQGYHQIPLALEDQEKIVFVTLIGNYHYKVTHRGIEVNPDQVKAINNLQPPRNPKEVQKLTRMTAALNRFIFRLADRCRPFFLLINKWKGFEWIEECALAFQQLKEYLSHPPIISSPEIDEVLFAYIAVAPYAVSSEILKKFRS